MSTHVEISVDVKCSWSNTTPAYRLYVNDELFAERTWMWRDKYLEELLVLNAVPGNYEIRCETLDSTADFSVNNVRVLSGPAHISGMTVRINNENT